MNETNFDWDDIRLFLAVARGGGLAAAVSSTGKSAPTLGRRMLSLERQLGRELFRRQARVSSPQCQCHFLTRFLVLEAACSRTGGENICGDLGDAFIVRSCDGTQ